MGAGHGTQILLRALEKLGGVDADVFGLARYPFDLESDHELAASVAATGRVLFVEEHYASGSIGESFARAFAGRMRAFQLMSARYRTDQRYGSPAFHLEQCGLVPDAVAAAARALSTS